MNTKKIISFLLLTVILLGISGCIGEDNTEVDTDLRNYNFSLEIKMISNEININSDEINIEVTLKNNEDHSFKINIERMYHLGIKIINPNNTEYHLDWGNITVEPEYKVIKSDGEYSIIHNLKDLFIINNKGERLEYNDTGNYTCQAFAYFLESNSIEFKITS